MRLLFTSLAAAAAIATVAVAHAQSQKGDLWDITSQMEMPGMPMPCRPALNEFALARNSRHFRPARTVRSPSNRN